MARRFQVQLRTARHNTRLNPILSGCLKIAMEPRTDE
jgi:hypothetical protein